MTLTSLFDDLYRPLRLRSANAKTVHSYRITFSMFGRFLGRPPTTADLTNETLARYLGWIRQKGRAAATANKERAQLLALWRFAARRGLLDHWPDVMPEREPAREPEAWFTPQLSKLIKTAATQPGAISGVPAGLWWVAIIKTVYSTGERIGAVLQLRWEHVDLDGGWLLVPAEFRKGQTADKRFRLTKGAIEALRAIERPRRAVVFPWPWCRGTLWNHFSRILRRAGLPHGRRDKWHRIRRTTASYFEKAGGNASALLGHSSRAVTKKYLDSRICGGQQPGDLLPDA